MISKEYLEDLYIDKKMKQKEIAELFDTDKVTIGNLIRKYELNRTTRKGKLPKNHNKNWTTEQEEYLVDNYGIKSYEMIGNSKKILKTASAVKRKATSMKLGDARVFDDCVTRNYIITRLNIDHRTIENWNKKYGLKITKRIVSTKQKVYKINLADFWSWAKKHSNLIKWNKFKENALGVEPTWTKKAREEFRKNNPEKHGLSWTNEEDKLLMSYYKAGIPLEKIAENLGKKRGAIDSRLDLIEAKRKDYIEWTKEMQKTLKKLIKKGLSTKEVSIKMDLPLMSVKGARERYITKHKRKNKKL